MLEETCFIKKMFTNEFSKEFVTTSLSKKTKQNKTKQKKQKTKKQSMEWKYTDSPVEKKFRGQPSIEKAILKAFYKMSGPIIIDFFRKRCNCKRCLLLPNSFGKIYFAEWPSYQKILTLTAWQLNYIWKKLN